MIRNIETLYDFDDLLIEPTVLSTIRTRKNINIKNERGNLPLLTAPMDTVVNEINYKHFIENKILPVLPRIPNPGRDYVNYGLFLSYSLEDFERIFLQKKLLVPKGEKIFALIDVANGHMENLYELSKVAKKGYKNSMCLMVGNVANPDTFYEYSKIGVDMIRIGIGNGNGCLTTVQTGVGYPMASLINECYKIKKTNNFVTKIVADGGFKKYSDIIKGLALGANYIMLGSILNKCLQSAGETVNDKDEVINQYSSMAETMFHAELPLYKTFRGMSTKEVQMTWGKEILTTSEGVVRKNNVEYTLNGWVKNFEDYLKSAMSYTGKEKIEDFIGGVNLNVISLNSFKRFDK